MGYEGNGIRIDCWMCPAYDAETFEIAGGSSEPGCTLEQLAKHAVFDFVDARDSGSTIDMIRAGTYLIGVTLANDIGGRARVGRAVVTVKNGPKFANLRDHARRHSNLSVAAYYKNAIQNMNVGRPFKFRHNGMTKRGFVTRIGSDRFRFTSTTLSGNRIFTHMELSRRNLQAIGITLP